nr:EF-hand domain-containing protein [uncultured Dongia sp.]
MISSTYGTAGPSSAALSQMRQQLFTKLDADEDGGISETEFVTGATSGSATAGSGTEALAKELFSSFDNDSDGKLTQDELESGFQKLSDQMRATLIEQQQAARPQQPSPEDMLAKLDSNADGGVDEAEFIAAAPQDGRGPSETELKELFASFDADEDGSLTADELQAGFESNRPQGGPASGPGGAGGPPPGPPPSSASSTEEDDEEDTLLEMLQKSITDRSTSASVNLKDLQSVLASFVKLQQSEVSQSYSATA